MKTSTKVILGTVALAAAVQMIEPLPAPDTALMVSQSTLLVAVQAQLDALAVRVMVPVAPAAPAVADTGEIEMEHTPDWVTVKFCPPTAMEPDREDVVVFGAAV